MINYFPRSSSLYKLVIDYHVRTIMIKLLLPGLVESRFFEQTSSVVYLHDVSVKTEFTISSLRDVFLTGVLGEAPLETLQDLLSSGKLELTPTNRFDDVCFRVVFGTDTQ